MNRSAEELPTHYAILDRVPAALHRPLVLHLHGSLLPRATAILELREALLAGRVPRQLGWPRRDLQQTLLKSLRDAKVAEECRGDATLTDEVLHFVLTEVEEAHRLYERSLLAFLAMGEQEACDASGSGFGDGDEGRGGGAGFEERARELAADMARELIARRTMGTWAARIEARKELGELFDALFETTGEPGMGCGVLRHLPVDSMMEMRRVLGNLDPLLDLIRALGRARESDDPDAPLAMISLPRCVSRTTFEEQPTSVAGAGEIRGIEHTGEVSRMLPSEAMLLTHPVLRRLWHVRRAERALLGYHAVGVMTARIQTRSSHEEMEEDERPADSGPIVLLLDTSGSMYGERSTVSKAVALQMIAMAHGEERPCFLLNFSRRGDLLELELTFDGDGLATLIHFLSSSFYGGTDPERALYHAARKLDDGDWGRGDLVILSDGEFYVKSTTLDQLARARRIHGARIHGVSVGRGFGFHELQCDSVHDVREWLR
ncbi:MAG: hypothetical protein JJ863_08040 [Deltaproteobacteria bacterium]|nr:hypothetical protein [Deltaproteobacteria bacterium]